MSYILLILLLSEWSFDTSLDQLNFNLASVINDTETVYYIDIYESKVLRYSHKKEQKPIVTAKKGEGPGELQSPILLDPQGKFLYIHDQSKVEVFTPDGIRLRSIQIPTGMVFLKKMTDGWITLVGMSAYHRKPIRLVWSDDSFQEQELIHDFEMHYPQRDTTYRNPVQSYPQFDVSDDGNHCFFYSGEGNQILVYNRPNRSMNAITVPGDPIPLTETMQESYRKRMRDIGKRGIKIKGPDYCPIVYSFASRANNLSVLKWAPSMFDNPKPESLLKAGYITVFTPEGKQRKPDLVDIYLDQVLYQSDTHVISLRYNKKTDSFWIHCEKTETARQALAHRSPRL